MDFKTFDFDFISNHIDDLHDVLLPLNLKIYENADSGFKEYIAYETLSKFLMSRIGWKVTPSIYGINAAFVAQFDTGLPGPVISFNAEYDAREELGFKSGHNLVAIASVAAALATAASMSKNRLPGKVVLFGMPAEELGGEKIKLIEAGAYRDYDVDVSMISRPGLMNDTALLRTMAYTKFKVEYFGEENTTSEGPGKNAVDGLISAWTALSLLRQQSLPGDLIQGQITNGGSSPNTIHPYAAGTFVVKANTAARLEEVLEKVNTCFASSAVVSGCTHKITTEITYKDHVPNTELGSIYRKAFNALGGSIPREAIDYEAGKSETISDQGDLSYIVPSLCVGFNVANPATEPDNPFITEAARSEKIFRTTLKVGKALACTGIEILLHKDIFSKVKREFEGQASNRLVKRFGDLKVSRDSESAATPAETPRGTTPFEKPSRPQSTFVGSLVDAIHTPLKSTASEAGGTPSTLRAEEVGYFNPEFKGDGTGVGFGGGHVIYNDVYSFAGRLEKLAATKGEAAIRKVFASCLRGSALVWHLMELSNAERQILSTSSLEEIIRVLIVRFREPEEVAMHELQTAHYTIESHHEGHTLRAFAQRLIFHARSLELNSVLMQLQIIRRAISLPAEIQSQLLTPTENTTLETFLENLDRLDSMLTAAA